MVIFVHFNICKFHLKQVKKNNPVERVIRDKTRMTKKKNLDNYLSQVVGTLFFLLCTCLDFSNIKLKKKSLSLFTQRIAFTK